MSNKSVVSFVAVLLATSRPVHIGRFVISVVVSSLQGVSLTWASAHIGEEILKRFQPPITHSNPAPSVVGIGLVGFVVAPLFHATPNSPFGAIAHAVLSATCNRKLARETAATPGPSLDHVAAANNTLFTAVATAEPEVARGSTLAGISENDETTKATPRKVFEEWMLRNRMLVSHDSYLSYGLWLEPAGVRAPVRLASFYHIRDWRGRL